MSELKELAFEAAAKGSPAGIVLMVFLIVGGIVQQQAPPPPPPPSLSAVSAFSNQNLFLETRVVCPSLISAETAKEKTFPSLQQSRAVARKSEAEDNSNRSAADETETNGAINLPEFSIPLLSSLLQLVPAVGLAKEGYEDLKSGSTQLVGRTRWLCLAIDKNAPLIRLSVVYLLGQAGTFGASQLARFAGTRPGLTFFDRCGQDSAISACKRAARENLKRVRLLPADILVVSKINSEDGSIEDKDFSANNESWASGGSSNTEYVFYEEDESAAEVPVLCQNTDSNFLDLFKSLHENPNFSSGSFGAATVSLLFGLCLLSQVRRSSSSSRFRPQKTDSVAGATQEIDDELLPTVSPRSACLWTIGEALAFLTAALSALALLIHFYSREPNSGSNLLLSVSLGAAVQLCLVLWSTFGNLFFDLRHLRDLGFWSRRQKQQQPTEATISSDRPAATSIGQ
jgi:hypothetical protein